MCAVVAVDPLEAEALEILTVQRRDIPVQTVEIGRKELQAGMGRAGDERPVKFAGF